MLLDFGPRGKRVRVGGGGQLQAVLRESARILQGWRMPTGPTPPPPQLSLHPLGRRPCSLSEKLQARAHFIVISFGGGGGLGRELFLSSLMGAALC